MPSPDPCAAVEVNRLYILEVFCVFAAQDFLFVHAAAGGVLEVLGRMADRLYCCRPYAICLPPPPPSSVEPSLMGISLVLSTLQSIEPKGKMERLLFQPRLDRRLFGTRATSVETCCI